MNGLF
jgi:hypothetical protein